MFFSTLTAIVLLVCTGNTTTKKETHFSLPLTFEVNKQEVVITSEDREKISFVLPTEAKIFAFDARTVCVIPKGFDGMLLIRRIVCASDGQTIWLLFTVTIPKTAPIEKTKTSAVLTDQQELQQLNDDLKTMKVSAVLTDQQKIQQMIDDFSKEK